jgi:tRNA modification GTPase
MSHTIAAISTGNQISAIGIIRLTGDGCIEIAGLVFTLNNKITLSDAPERKLVLGQLHDRQGRVIDSCCAIVARGPHSYTGEDTVEFHCHGSPAVLAAGLEALYAAGALPAKRGEFTKRAFLNGKLDLTQAEAVIDLIEADTAEAAANAAGQVEGVLQKKLAPIYNDLTDLCSHFHAVLDYPDEDIEDFGLASYEGALRQDQKALQAILQTYHQGQILRNGVSAAIEAGHVFIPEGPAWAEDFLDQWTAFPTGRHDDMVDSSSQALNWLFSANGAPEEEPEEEDRSDLWSVY